ncbi:nuclear hormone receptor family member nhr-48 isoform X4 [Octopus bimaculoides]|uniref:nuclear hormone receptor family member nhr-48 isoform X4 n=1 Tax=Octopus bimaculoides TaxID=37653 RepID=UPI0022E880B5|nr:nuclear hormone receptor family member nhr-48 isoform X4 [Octopus bimaculoides]
MDAMLSLWQRPQTQQQRKLHAATMDAVRIYCYPTHAAVSQPVFPRLGDWYSENPGPESSQQHSSLNPALRARFDEEIDRLYNVAPDSFEDSNSMEPVSNHYPSVESRQLSANSAEAIKSRKNKEDKYCGVCGDRALGYNFDAISCESCKAFFRRNAPKGLDYFKCPYEEKCKMDVSNRRFCKKCRLRKCFEIGMRKEYILTEEEKMRKRQRIEENRYVRP